MVNVIDMDVDDLDVETSLISFAENILGFDLYDWQCAAIEPFDEISERITQVTLLTPNESGKSGVVIPSLVFGLLSMYPLAKIVLTTADGKQLDSQLMPAIYAHRSKFPSWKFIDREIYTPGPDGDHRTGGHFFCFTTDQAGRAEGHHKHPNATNETGPLLLIADEAKSIPEEIFSALDRCGYNGILLASSAGKMSGRFYKTQFANDLDYIKVAAGLIDCPHISASKVKRIIEMHGSNSPFTRSALHGEFIEAFDGNPVYYAYERDYHEAKNLGWPKGARMVVGMDVGTNNATVIMALKRHKGHDYIWILREIILSGSDTERQTLTLLNVLATEFPFWNSMNDICPEALFFCDPAARNSAFTTGGPTGSALKVIQSHGIFPGMKTGLRLQPSIAIVNRLLQQSHMEGDKCVWHVAIDTESCPTLTSAMRGQYRYPVSGENGWGSDQPLKGSLCNNVDHPCFVAGTLITTLRGDIPIESVRIGDEALTRKGWKRVVKAELSNPCAEVWTLKANGAELIGTADHPIWTQYGWIPLYMLTRNDTLSTCNQKPPNSTARFTAAIRFLRDAATAFISRITRPISITPYGDTNAEQSQKGNTSITATETRATTQSKISNALTQKSTPQDTGRPNERSDPPSASDLYRTPQKYGTEATRVMHGTQNTPSDSDSENSWRCNASATAAEKISASMSLLELLSRFAIVQTPANRRTGDSRAGMTSKSSACIAARYSEATNTLARRIAVRGVRRSGVESVYNLTVEDAHEYFANGILVSNCDAMRYGLCNIFDIDTETHEAGMTFKSGHKPFVEPKRTI